jgi:hypothetical protein
MSATKKRIGPKILEKFTLHFRLESAAILAYSLLYAWFTSMRVAA